MRTLEALRQRRRDSRAEKAARAATAPDLTDSDQLHDRPRRRRRDSRAEKAALTAVAPDPTVSGWLWCCSVAITIVIAAASFILSFIALRDLCVQAGQPEETAFLFPVIIDGTILQATLGVVTQRHNDRSRKFFWKILTAAAAVSIAGNAIHAVLTIAPGFNPILAAVIATLPPAALLASTHSLTVLGRRAATTRPTQQPQSQAVPVPAETHHHAPAAVARTVAPAVVARELGRQLEVPLPELDGVDPIPQFRSHEERREWALARREADVDITDIAREVDRSVATVYRWISESPKSHQVAV
ncbi:DUF2637 domain-containing protein [Rhodococcus phenolicus]|uniref:DUF2637 domain-containing protein n=1 Tax=Rhodococcus phenolicus TaxID=263849 RepID=UPI000AB443D2|nr:DUF2637 domain-containing protein [Rhodococcus phenolicus]